MHRSFAVFFDVDGVLIDSLPQHLQICRDKAREFNLDLKIPEIQGFRELVSHGTKISPMKYFFLSVGFPAEYADRAVVDYDREFAKKYRPRLFEGVPNMLDKLRALGFSLGLVTSNTRQNVEAVLGNLIELFDESCLFFFNSEAVPRAKASYLMQGARELDAASSDCMYIGDQPADIDAARDAGIHFLGVTYGWGILAGESRVPTADSVDDIPDRVLGVFGHVC